MVWKRIGRRLREQWQAVEAPPQDGLNRAVTHRLGGECPLAGRFTAILLVELGEAHDAEARPEALLDVGRVAEAWLDADPLLFGRFHELFPNASPQHIRRVLVLTAALHDLGKVYPQFQVKSKQGWNEGYATLGDQPRPDGKGFDHGAATAALLDRFIKRSMLPNSYKLLRRLLYAAASHHGALYGKDIVDSIPLLDQDHEVLALALVEEVEHHFGPMPMLLSGPGNDFCMYAAGFISVCDWIGSDNRVFRFEPWVRSRADAEVYLKTLEEARAAEQALQQAGLIATFVEEIPDFATFFGFSSLLPLQQVAEVMPFGEVFGAEMAIIEEERRRSHST